MTNYIDTYLRSLTDLQLRLLTRCLYEKMQRMVRYEDPLKSPKTNGPIKTAYNQAMTEISWRHPGW